MQIAKALNLHRETVRTYYYADSFPERQMRPVADSILDPYLPYLQNRYEQGNTNASQLWREIREQGFPGTARSILQWMKPRRKEPAPSTPKKYQGLTGAGQPSKPPANKEFLPVRDMVWLFMKDPATLTQAEVLLSQYLCQDKEANLVYGLAQQFTQMVRQRLAAELDAWVKTCLECQVRDLRNFAKGILEDYDAVYAALATPWSSGQTEGQVNRLKLLKRQMYGRANLDLLRCRLLYAP